MIQVSSAVNIRRFQNLLDTSVDVTERATIQGLIDKEKAAAALPPKNPQKQGRRDRE